MNIEEFRAYCIAKPDTTEEFPFDESVLVFKVLGKMYALTNIDAAEFTVNLKCDPEYALELREQYTSIIPGYHMSKKHWNTVNVDQGEVSKELLLSLINQSYDLVVDKLTKKQKEALKSL